MDLSEHTNQTENENSEVLLSLKEPNEDDLEYDVEYTYHTKTSYDDELDQSIHIPKKKKKAKKQIILDDFGMDSSEEEEKNAANIEWRDVESLTRQSLCGSDHDKALSSVDLLEEGINLNDIPKEFPQKSCYSTIHSLISSLFSSLKNFVDSFIKTNKKNQ
jgi:hypothetical protein|uniref:Uncharacterized protein n=1 Tax=viral metagenome TaxID=1070528 RepID=A0A6C0DKL7_9ZZZZ